MATVRNWAGIAIALMALPHAPARAQDTSDPLVQAHAMHQSLETKPAAERTPSDYDAIVDVLAPVAKDKTNPSADTARFETGSLYVDLAQELHRPAAYTQAAQAFLDLLHASPYTAYRRNAEWALAQVQIFHLREPKSAAVWLRDFVERYPADPRAALAQKELRGETIPEPAILSANDPLPIGATTAAPLDGTTGSAADAVSDETPPEVVPPAKVERPTPNPVHSPAPPATTAPPHTPASPAAGRASDATVGDVAGIHVTNAGGSSNVVIALRDAGEFTRGSVPESHLVYYDVKASFPATGKQTTLQVGDGRIRSIHIAENRAGVTRIVLQLMPGASADAGHLFPNPSRLVISVSGASQ